MLAVLLHGRLHPFFHDEASGLVFSLQHQGAIMKTKALTSAALIAYFAAFSPVIAQTAAPQGGTGSGNATSSLAKDGGQNGVSTSGASLPGKMPNSGKAGMNGTNGSASVNEKSSANDASSTAVQGGGASPLTTGEGMKQPSRTVR